MQRKPTIIHRRPKRIRLGIWGLGRGSTFQHSCEALNIDVVAGCDFHAGLRAAFQQTHPGALVTDDDEKFLAADMDAVVVATYCPSHAPDVIRCLRAGKHVLSEVTSFHTMAEGVALVEAAQAAKKVYNLAENYPFSAPNMYLARTWREGLFGDLMYAEYEYVHECRMLVYTYLDGEPVKPGNTTHTWRGWLDYHYYCTHSLGPIMVITGGKPTRVTALPAAQTLPGFPLPAPHGEGKVAPSLIQLDNGAVVRNLMGTTTNDTHVQRLWGTRGAAELHDQELRLRLGGGGWAPKEVVNTPWEAFAEEAIRAGHGGGDFWTLYYFARQIRTGEPAPFDLDDAVACTLPGILAYRSSCENGAPYDVPDFRRKADRDRWRHDTFACPRYDVAKGCFPRNADPAKTERFATLMRDLDQLVPLYRAWDEYAKLADAVKDKSELVALSDRLLEHIAPLQATVRAARALAAAYPRSDGARLLREMLSLGDQRRMLSPTLAREVKQARRKWARQADAV